MSAGSVAAARAWAPPAQLALDTLEERPVQGIPNTGVNLMHIPLLEEIAGYPPGAYPKDPDTVYLAFQKAIGACTIDQFIPKNPLSMTATGFDSSRPKTATTGRRNPVCDDLQIDSPEAVAEHLERFVFPRLEREIAAFRPEDEAALEKMLQGERSTQELFGEDILKIPYGNGYNNFPHFRYGTYGYEHYFMAFAEYPELMERDFRLQADLAVLKNRRACQAYDLGGFPRTLRLDHDMAGTKSLLVNVKQLDRLWTSHFARAIAPYVRSGIRLIWHCDGNLMALVPRLIEAGVSGFQGFQYETGMDYLAICRLKDRQGRDLIIHAGVSVTTTLPFGTPEEVRREMRWLVENGPPKGLFLGASSSITPSTNPANVREMLSGFRYYREQGRGGA